MERAIPKPPVHRAFCERCDKQFVSSISRKAALNRVRDHTRLAHEGYKSSWDDDE